MPAVHQHANRVRSNSAPIPSDRDLPLLPPEETAGHAAARRSVNGGRYIGNMSFTMRQLIGARAANGCADWFAGANAHFTHTARTAIQKALALLNLQAGDEILVPAYHCGSELDVLLKAGLAVRLYRVSDTAAIDVADLRQRITRATKAVYVIHYFGFPQPMDSLADLCRSRGLHLIEDCALSSLTLVDGRRIGQTGAVAVYNFPKMLPVPDGGAVVMNNGALPDRVRCARPAPIGAITNALMPLFKQSFLRNQPQASARFLSAALRRSETPHGIESGRLGIPDSYYFTPAMSDRKMSPITRRVLDRTDLADVRERRRDNYSRLLSCVSQISGARPLFGQLPAGVCPLCLPVIVQNARGTARALRARSIPAIAWWSGYHRADLNWNEFPEAAHLKDHVLALPVHQQLNARDMEWMGNRLAECIAAD